MKTISMDDVELLDTDVFTDNLPPLPDILDFPDIPDIPDFPDIPENVIIVPAAPLPVTELLSFPPWHSTTTTETATNTQLTYVTEGNISYPYQPNFGMASNATTTTINDPTATEETFTPPTPMLTISPWQAESGPSSPEKQKADDSVFLTPLPVTSPARPVTRITRNIPKPRPSSNLSQNNIIKALLAQNSTPYLNRVSASNQRNFIVRASSQNPRVTVSMPASLANLLSGTPARPLHAENVLLTQSPSLRSAYVKTSTAGDFIPQSSSDGTVITTHVTTTTSITTPMTAAPQLTYAISPIRVATTENTAVTKTVTTSTGPSIVVISTPSPSTRAAGATQSQTYVPVQHFYKAKPGAIAAEQKIHNLVRSKALPDSPRANVASSTSITMLGPRSLITTTAGSALSVQPPHSANTHALTHNYTYLEPGEIKIIETLPPRSFPGPRTALVAQRQASASAAMQQQATIISKMKAARHAQHHAESMSRLELGSVQHAASLAALQEESHAWLVAAAQEARLKAQRLAVFQANIQAALDAQNAVAISPTATQAQALPAPLQLPVTSAQTVSPAQPHGKMNVKLLNPALAQLLANAKAQFHATSQGETQRVVYSQAQGRTLAASRPHNESLGTSQLQARLLATSHLQDQPLAASRPQNESLATSQLQARLLATSHLQDQPWAASRPQNESLGTSQLRARLLATSHLQDQPLAASRPQNESKATSQLQARLLATSHLQDQPLAASRPQNESLATSQLQARLLATSHLQDQPLAASCPQNEYFTTSQLQGQPLATPHLQGQPLATSKPQGHHLTTSQAQLIATSQSQGPIVITSQRQAQRLIKSQSQGPILVAPQRQALLATTQSQSQLLATSQTQSHATLPTQPNVTPPVQIKSKQANATLIAQLNAPPQKIIIKGLHKFPRMHYHPTPTPLKTNTQAQLDAFNQAQIKTSQRLQQTGSPTVIQMISPRQQSAARGRLNPRPRRRMIITTRNSAPPIDKTSVTQGATNEAVTASKSLNEQLPITSSASQQIGEVTSSSIQTTNTPTVSSGTTLVMPHYKTTVFKNLSAIGRAESTQLPTPTTTSGEIMVLRRSAAYFPARRSFPTTTQSLTATAITTPKTTTTATTTPVIHILRTVPRHMLASLQPGNVRARSDSEIPVYIIKQNKPKSEEKPEENSEENSEEKSDEKSEENN